MKKILVAYTTNAGSTTEVAEAIADTLRQDAAQVDVRRVENVTDLGDYDAGVVGAPMAMGWHKDAVKFLTRHQQALSRIPVAYFLTALELVKTGETTLQGVPIYQDPTLAKPPKNESKLSFKEKQATVAAYLGPALKKAPLVKPVSAGFFAGKLDYSKLNIFQKLFVKIIMRGKAGDYRNWEAIRDWAASLNQLFSAES